MRSALRAIHRYASLSLAALWLLQALTGLTNVFHRELDDWVLGAKPTVVDVEALGHSVLRLEQQRPQARVSSIFAGGGVAGQYDVFVSDERSGTRVVRMDGEGRVLRERPWAHDYGDAGVLHLARIFHEHLLSGDRGKVFVGLSGLLLLTNLLLGLKLAWPRRSQWRQTLLPKVTGAWAARLYAWHRAAGLWVAALAMISVGAGVLVALGDPLHAWLGAGNAPPRLEQVEAARDAPAITHAQAMQTALARYPGSTIALVTLPSEEEPWYAVRLLLPDDVRRVFGTTVVFVAARGGAVLADYDARRDSLATRFVNSWYATHTGEIAGLPGRLAALLVALWLLTMIGLGVSMWWARSRARSAARSATQVTVRNH